MTWILCIGILLSMKITGDIPLSLGADPPLALFVFRFFNSGFVASVPKAGVYLSTVSFSNLNDPYAPNSTDEEQVARDEFVTGDGDSQIRLQRLTKYLAAWQTWLHTQCELTPEQKALAGSLCEDAVQESQRAWLARRGEGRLIGLPDYAPLEMTRSPGPTEPTNRTSFQTRLRKLLQPDQLNSYIQSMNARSLRLLDADRARVIAEIDEQLHLSDDQRARLENELRALIRNSNTSLFGFETAGSPLEYLSPKVVAWRISELDLTTEQRLTMESYFPELQRREASVVRMVLGLKNWESELSDVAKAYSDSLKKEMQARVEEYATLWKLTANQRQHLHLAATGAVTRTVSEWRATTMEKLVDQSESLKRMAKEREIILERARAANQLRQMQGLAIPSPGVSLAIPVNAESLDLTRVQNHPVWKRAVAQLRREINIPGTKRTAWGVDSCIDFTLTTFDRELWLSDNQLESVRNLIATAMPKDIDKNTKPGRELLYLSIALKQIRKTDLQPILNPAQTQAWDQLANQFDYTDDSVQISLRDGSKFVLEYTW